MNGRYRFRSAQRLRLRLLLLFFTLTVSSRIVLAQATAQQSGPGVGERSTPVNAVPEKREQEQDETYAYRHSKSVLKFGSLLGLSPDQAATSFELLNFLVLAIGIGYLAVKTLPKKFRERDSAIQRHLVDARTATEEASTRLNAVEDRLARLDAEIAGMRTQIEAETLREEQRMKATVADETAIILAAADAEIQAATLAARRELQRHAAELAIQHAAQRLVVSAETDRLLVQGFAQRLMGEKGGQN